MWVKFLQTHSLTPSTYSHLATFDQDYVAACYTLSLTQGHTLTSRKITTQCIKNYLQAARIPKRHNPLSNSNELSFPPLVQDVLSKHSKLESVPNRREPVTISMLTYWNTLALQSLHPDSLESAQFDWFVLGMLAGFRKSEWLQDSFEYRKTKTFNLNVDGSTKAFIASDFQFINTPTTCKTEKHSSHNIPHLLQITWRFQKNGQNGQQITFLHNNQNPRFSPVPAAQRILARARRLGVPSTSPIAVFSNNGALQYMHHNIIESAIKKCAQHVYNCTPTQLKLYSCHSIRVGACVLLHSTQPDPLYIQFRLRWRSQSFISYLRNTPRLASLHNNILNTTDSDRIS